MDKEFYWWSAIIVVVMFWLTVVLIDSKKEVEKLEICKSLRIKGLDPKYFIWEGIVELNQKGEYQPKCL